MSKMNCWEFNKCGREPGGEEKELGVCPATRETRLDGVNGGKNGGRACWVLTGTLCGDQVQGTLAKKLGDCMKCEFYQLVEAQEGADYEHTKSILVRLWKRPGGER